MVVVTVVHGGSLFARLLARVRADPVLVARMWVDAESRPDELDVPGTRWSVVVVGGEPAAWCAARVTSGGVLKCHSNFERPGYRGRGWYAAAYAERHRAVVEVWPGAAVTYLFAQPIGLHEADGWYRTGVTGVGELGGHRWWELRRPSHHTIGCKRL